MDANKRRELILDKLIKSNEPSSATKLAKTFSVSRQVIVGDIAILRASGRNISATPRGYILDAPESTFPYIGIIPCKHNFDQLQTELYTIVDFGGTIIDVSIDHPIYGELFGQLNISSRYDADLFLSKVSENTALPLSALSGGIHLHKIGCKSEEIFAKISAKLKEENILV
ncbi:MAG: transcription repressor NadR [Anaerovoracaceae bacterium]